MLQLHLTLHHHHHLYLSRERPLVLDLMLPIPLSLVSQIMFGPIRTLCLAAALLQKPWIVLILGMLTIGALVRAYPIPMTEYRQGGEQE